MNPQILLSIVAFAISLIAVVLAYRAQSCSNRLRPVLVFSRGSDTLWQIQNVGEGPSLQVIIADSDRHETWTCVANCSPVGAKCTLNLPWIKNGYGLVAIYSDIDGNQFTSLYKDGVHSISRGNIYPHLKPTHDEWFLLIASDENNTSTLKETDLEGKTAFELDVIRNEFYARYGYMFKRRDLAEYFLTKSWYRPTTDNQFLVYSKFSSTDRYNAELVLRYQKANNIVTN